MGASNPANKPALRRMQASVSQIDFRQILMVLRAHFLPAFGLALVVCTLIVWHQLSRPKMYAGHCTLVLDVSERMAVGQQGRSQFAMEDLLLTTRLEQLRSDDLVQRVVASLTPEERVKVLAPYQSAKNRQVDSEAQLTSIVRGGVSSSRLRRSSLIRIDFTHRDPKIAALLSNRYAEQFIRHLMALSTANNDAALMFLREQAEDLKTKLEKSEQALQAYREKYHLVSLEESQNIVVDRLKSLNSHATAARVARLAVEVKLHQAEKLLENELNPIELASIDEFKEIASVQTKLDDLKGEREVMAQRYGPRHPAMVKNANTMHALEGLRQRQIKAVLTSLRSQLDKAKADENQLQQQLAQAEKESLRLGQIGVEYNVLRRAIDTQKASYTQILSRLNDATINSQLQSVNLKISDMARPNYVPVAPNLKKAFLIVALLGLGIIFGYPFGVELIFARIRSWADVEYYLGATLLGEVCQINGIKGPARAHLLREESDEVAGEQLRALFTQYGLISKIDPPKSLLVTSTVPDEGKSFIASNLAYAFVAHGRRVLLVDGDLRRPSQHRQFGVDNSAGTLRWLNDGANLEGDIEQNPSLGLLEVHPGLFLLRAGGNSRQASELMSAGRLTALFEALQRRFDVMIFDTPPTDVFPDAISFASVCHEFIYVCRFNKASRHQVRVALERLKRTGLESPGVVINGMPAGRGSSVYYQSYSNAPKYYARYYHRDKS